MLRKLFFIHVLFFLVALNNTSAAQLLVKAIGTGSPVITKDSLISRLIGTGISGVSNVTYAGANAASGVFNYTGSALGLKKGILLTSGSVTNAVGPNDQNGRTRDNNQAANSLLNTISTIVKGNADASVLEFDFVPSDDSLQIKFVFASEEYLEYVSRGYNDVFAFFVYRNTPPNNGPFNKKNLALVPGTTDIVSVDNINDVDNNIYYINNPFNLSGPYTTEKAQNIQYDGFTTPIVGKIGNLVPGDSYHMVIGVQDVGDADLDAGVFIESASFKSSVLGCTLSSPTVGPAQSICSGGSVTDLDGAVLNGSGAETYVWEQSTDNTTWTVIPGATSKAYTPSSTTTYYYRRRVDDGACSVVSSSVLVTIYAPVTAGVIATDQNVCNAGNPAAFTETTAASGADNVFTYQWQSDVGCVGTWTDIPGATSATYDAPAGITQTTCYRRVTTNATCATTVNTNAVQVTVYSALNGGTVAADQTICNGGNPALFTETASATGGNGSFSYQWQSQANCSGVWTNIGGATASTYDPPTGLTQTTCYRRVATNTCGSVNSNTITVTVYSAITAGVIGSAQSICNGGNPAAFTETTPASGADNNFTYQWQEDVGCLNNWTNIPGATAATYDVPAGLTQTTCYRRVTTNALCGVSVNTNSVQVTVYSPVVAGSVAGNQTICNGGDPAAFTQVTAPSGGNGAFTFQWQSDAGCVGSWVNIPGATASTYDVPAGLTQTTCYRRVETNTTCNTTSVNSNTLTVTVYNALNGGTISGNQTVCTFGDPVAFTQTAATGGNGGFTYQWQGDVGCIGTWVDIPLATAATYDVPAGIAQQTCYRRKATNVTCNASPVYSNVVTISLNANPVINSVVKTDVTVCNAGDGTIAVNATGTPSLTYSINGGTSFVPGNSFNNLADGGYTVVVSDGNSCKDTAAVTILNGGAPNAPAAQKDSVYCSGQSLDPLTATAGFGGTLNWYDDFALTNMVGTGSTFTPANTIGATTYYVTETFGGCRSQAKAITITINAPLLVDAGLPASLCEGATIALTGTSGAGVSSVAWSSANGGTFQNGNSLNPVYTPSAAEVIAGTAKVYITTNDAVGPCGVSVDSVTLTIIPAPVKQPVSFNPNDTICEGASTQLDVTGVANVKYDIYNAQGNSLIGKAPQTVSPASSTKYYTIATDTITGCTQVGAADTVQVTVNPAPAKPTLSALPSAICEGDTATISVVASPSNVINQVYQLPGNVLIGSAQVSVFPTDTTRYYIVATDTITGCTQLVAADTFAVNVIPAPVNPTVAFLRDTICEGSSTSISITGSLPANQIAQVFDTLGTLLGNTPLTVSPTSTSVYIIKSSNTVTGCQQLTPYDTITVVVNAAPLAGSMTSSHKALCLGDSATIILANNPQTGVVYTVFENGVALPSTYPLTVTPDSTSVYTIQALDTTTGCLQIAVLDSITIKVNSLPGVTGIGVVDSARCGVNNGFVKGLSPIGDNPPFTYLWKDSLGNVIGFDQDLVNVGIGKYTLTVTDSNGCVAADTNSYYVPGSPGVNAGFVASPTSGIPPLNVSFTNTSTGNTKNHWDFGNGLSGTTVNATSIYNQNGTYTVTLIVGNDYGCYDTATTVINVDVVSDVTIPNVFTPNGDGTNDGWTITSTGLRTLKVDIYNRWGMLLYTLQGIGASWDGRTTSGEICSDGTYYYILKADGWDGKTFEKQGFFQLLK